MEESGQSSLLAIDFSSKIARKAIVFLKICKSIWRFQLFILPLHSQFDNAEIAQLVEHDLAKVGVAGPSPVFRSISNVYHAAMVELVDTRDLKSLGQ